jgi:hypothetical protein
MTNISRSLLIVDGEVDLRRPNQNHDQRWLEVGACARREPL